MKDELKKEILEKYETGADVDDYLVCTDEEADEAVEEYIKGSAWAFNTSFILECCSLDRSGEESLKQMQEKSCESANDFILSLIEQTCGLTEFCAFAESADGRGHFLSPYDGEEIEFDYYDTTYYIYRMN